MSKQASDWYLPPEVLGLLSTILLVPTVAVLAGVLFPVVIALRHGDVFRLYSMGVLAGCAGVVLLFFARMPLYRQRKFWTFGPRALDRFHRRIYWLAYALIIGGVVVLVDVAVRLR